MILLTIGTQLAFNRLIEAMDEIIPAMDMPVYGQIGSSTYQPKNFPWARTLAPAAFEEKFSGADVIVSHAGIGTVLTAQRFGKPIILFPREAKFGEHRNDHQIATCAQLTGRPGIAVARTADQLLSIIQSGDLAAASANDLQTKRESFVSSLAQRIQALTS